MAVTVRFVGSGDSYGRGGGNRMAYRQIRCRGGAGAVARPIKRSPARSAGRSHTNVSAPRSKATVTWPNATPHPSTLAPPRRSSIALSASGAASETLD